MTEKFSWKELILSIVLLIMLYILIVFLTDLIWGASYFNGHCINIGIFKPAHWVINKILGIC